MKGVKKKYEISINRAGCDKKVGTRNSIFFGHPSESEVLPVYCFGSAMVRCFQVVMVTPPSLALLPPLVTLRWSSSLSAP